MEREYLVNEIRELIEKYGFIHCYEGIIGNCMPPNQSEPNIGSKTKTINGVFYEDDFKRGFIQGFHQNYVTVVTYINAKPVEAFSMSYNKLPVKYLTECLNFLRRK